MTRRKLSTLFRILGNATTGVVVLIMVFAMLEEDKTDEFTLMPLLAGAGVGMLLVAIGVGLRYWPESEASIRRRFDAESDRTD